MAAIDAVRAGAAIGLAVALPLGPIGLIVVTLGRRAWRTGAAAAGGVAAADGTWAAVAVSGGAVLAARPELALWHAVARGALVAIGALLVVRGLRGLRHPDAVADRDPGPAIPAADAPGARWFATLYGLTLPNPLTVAVFTAAVVGADIGTGTAAKVWFALAVGLTSLAWQLLLATAGWRLLGRRGPRAAAALTIASGAALIAWPLIS